ncbi:hypothetical protein [Archangium violaceum]|uniref:Pyridoxamine 5'-phosphate oxidase putative domain-containing protein n=1 Tax=Archangium violaceum Cb vi76 TaxID=1406225 RepID=A0A084SV97_9BACT|nr:hypothetical protein [Archangium violaceum]KFA92382.1 hypothetical protein Q664_15340 [Archangium violaceum Cb vi76]
MARIHSVEELERTVGSRPVGVMMKSLDALDEHCVRLLGLSSFAAIGFIDGEGRARVTTAGGSPGFARVEDPTHVRLDGTRLAVADRPGNRRTDTFHNVIEQPRAALLASMAVADRVPKLALWLRNGSWTGP